VLHRELVLGLLVGLHLLCFGFLCTRLGGKDQGEGRRREEEGRREGQREGGKGVPREARNFSIWLS
jgi:hypothetical protein